MIRVIVADDHTLVRSGIRRMLAAEADIEVVAEAASGEEVLRTAHSVAADVLLLDITMPGPGFLEMLRRLKTSTPALRVLVVSMHPEALYAVRALKAGAAGYVTKDHTPLALIEAVRRLYAGRRYITEAVAEQLAGGLDDDGEQPGHERLSDREFEVLRAIGSGLGVTEIARDMHLSPKTVSTYRARVLEKLGFDNNADIMRYVIEHGFDSKGER